VIPPATRRLVAVARGVWRETTDAHERMLARPWEQDGPLRWQRDAGGPKLLGSELSLRASPGDDVER
jgi:hypothetical protein